MGKRGPSDKFHVVETMMAAERNGHADDADVKIVVCRISRRKRHFRCYFVPYRSGGNIHFPVRHDPFFDLDFALTFAFSFPFAFYLDGKQRCWRGFAVAGLVHAHRIEFVMAVATHPRGIKRYGAHGATLRHKITQRIAAGGICVPVERTVTVPAEIHFHVIKIVQPFCHFVGYHSDRGRTGVSHRGGFGLRRDTIGVGNRNVHGYCSAFIAGDIFRECLDTDIGRSNPVRNHQGKYRLRRFRGRRYDLVARHVQRTLGIIADLADAHGVFCRHAHGNQISVVKGA